MRSCQTSFVPRIERKGGAAVKQHIYLTYLG